MKIFSKLLLLSFMMVSVGLFAQDEETGGPLPSVTVKNLNGQSLDLADYGSNGKITVISFWATWCTPCKKELDAIADIYEDWQDEFGDFELLAITIDNARQLTKVPGIVSTKGWEFEVLSADQNEIQNALNFQTIPHTFLVDAEGNIVYSHSGYVPGDEMELEDQIRELVEE